MIVKNRSDVYERVGLSYIREDHIWTENHERQVIRLGLKFWIFSNSFLSIEFFLS